MDFYLFFWFLNSSCEAINTNKSSQVQKGMTVAQERIAL
jgi:hypothetical protein